MPMKVDGGPQPHVRLQTLLERRLRPPAELALGEGDVEDAAQHVPGAGRRVRRLGLDAGHAPAASKSSFTDVSVAGADVEDAAVAAGRRQHGRDDVADVDVVAGLLAVAEDRHALAAARAGR